MPPIEKPLAAKPAEAKMPSKPMNVWMIISLVLLIVAVGAIALAVSPKLMGGKKMISAKAATDAVVSFVNEIYGAQLGTITAKDQAVLEVNGLYKITLVITKEGAPVEESVYVTTDGKTFIPSGAMIDMAKMREDYKAFQAQQQQQPAAPTATAPAADTNTDTNQPAPTGAAE